MPMSQKEVREFVGYTFLNVEKNPSNWFKLARQFNEVALVIDHLKQDGLSQAYLYNAGLSLELSLKAILILKTKSFKRDHSLIDLAKAAEIPITRDQECTLELITEIIKWAGRYPVPKKSSHWDDWHDKVLSKHLVRHTNKNGGGVTKIESRFPTHKNCQALWKALEHEFTKLQQT